MTDVNNQTAQAFPAENHPIVPAKLSASDWKALTWLACIGEELRALTALYPCSPQISQKSSSSLGQGCESSSTPFEPMLCLFEVSTCAKHPMAVT